MLKQIHVRDIIYESGEGEKNVGEGKKTKEWLLRKISNTGASNLIPMSLDLCCYFPVMRVFVSDPCSLQYLGYVGG